MPRLPWYLRGIIAISTGILYALWMVLPDGSSHRVLSVAIGRKLLSWFGYSHGSLRASAPILIAWFLPVITVSLLTYGLLGWVGRSRQSVKHETYCRHCGYILRGISEPRCPECGERI